MDTNTLALALFCFLVAALMAYFRWFAEPKLKATGKQAKGLWFVAGFYGIIALLGMVYYFDSSGDFLNTVIALSGLSSMSLLIAMPFFTGQPGGLNQLINHPQWKNGIKFFAIFWLLLAMSIKASVLLIRFETLMSIVAIALFLWVMFQYFKSRNMRFIGFIALSYLVIYTLIQLATFLPFPADASDSGFWNTMMQGLSSGRFEHPNMMILAPALSLSVIFVSYTFSWINELNFYELSSIWVDQESAKGEEKTWTGIANKEQTDAWLSRISEDELEEVIPEIMSYKKHHQLDITEIVLIASRNAANNRKFRQGLVTNEVHNTENNLLRSQLLHLIRRP